MNLKTIEQISKNNTSIFRVLTGGFIRSLTPKQACGLLKKYYDNPFIREKVITVITDNLQKKTFAIHHKKLLEYLYNKLHGEELYYCKNAVANCLDALIPYVGKLNKIKILKSFLLSNYRGIRKKAYKHNLLCHSSLQKLLLHNLLVFSEAEDSLINIIAYCSNKFIMKHFKILYKAVQDYSSLRQKNFWLLKEFFLKFPTLNSWQLKKIKSVDRITYIYVCAIRHHKIGNKEAIDMYMEELSAYRQYIENLQKKSGTRYHSEDKRKLILWCYAKLGLWQVIGKLLKKDPSIFEKSW